MRKALTLLLVLSMAIPCLGGMSVNRRSGIVAVAGPYDDILFWFNGESTADSGPPDNTGDYNLTQTGIAQEFSAGDNTGSFQTSNTCAADGSCIQGTTAKIGSYALRVDMGGNLWSHLSFDAASIHNGNEGSVGAWYRTSVTTGVNPWVFRIDGGTGHIGIQHNGSSVWFYYVDGTATTCAVNSSVAISADTWYYFEGEWDSAADTYQIHITTEAGATTSDLNNVSTCGAAATHTTVYVGGYGGTTDESIQYVDNFAISNDYGRDLTALRSEVASPR